MLVADAVAHFGSQTKMAEALGITDAAISLWVKRGGIVPIKQALRINQMSDGEVDLRLNDYRED